MNKKLHYFLISLLAVCGLLFIVFPVIRFIGFALLFFALMLLIRLKFPRFSLAVTLTVLILYSLAEIPLVSAALAQPEEDLDYVIVLGAALYEEEPGPALMERLEAAHEYLLRNPDTLCVLSGGQGEDEAVSEALAMKRYLLFLGIEEDRLLIEDRSVNTNENMKFSFKVIEEHAGASLEDLSIGVLSSEYHLFRAGFLAEKHGVHLSGTVPAYTRNPVIMINYFLREVVGMGKAILLDH